MIMLTNKISAVPRRNWFSGGARFSEHPRPGPGQRHHHNQRHSHKPQRQPGMPVRF